MTSDNPALMSERVSAFKRQGLAEPDAIRQAQPVMRRPMGMPPPAGSAVLRPAVMPGSVAGPMLPDQPPDIPGVGAPTAGPVAKMGPPDVGAAAAPLSRPGPGLEQSLMAREMAAQAAGGGPGRAPGGMRGAF